MKCCGENCNKTVKYKCPVLHCQARYCSVNCCKEHKAIAHLDNNVASLPASSTTETSTLKVMNAIDKGDSSDNYPLLNSSQKKALCDNSTIIKMLKSKRLCQQIALIDGIESDEKRAKLLHSNRCCDVEFSNFIDFVLETIAENKS